jgi:hypothetical protein
MSGGRRTDTPTEVFAGQSPIAAFETLVTFRPRGQSLDVYGEFAAAVGIVTVSLQRLAGDGVTWQEFGGPRYVWTQDVAAAGSGFMPLSGLVLIPMETYRLVFVCTIGGVPMTLAVIPHDGDATERTSPILEEIAENTGLYPAVAETLADVVSLTDGGGGYPFTGYLPAAAGRLVAGLDDIVVDLTITGGAGVGDDITARIEAQWIAGGGWSDITLAGYDVRTGSAGFASWTAPGAGAAVGATPHFDNSNAYAVRVAYDLLDASGAVRIDLRRERGDA